MRPLWGFLHNVICCPLVGCFELFTWGRYAPGCLLDLYCLTATHAGYWPLEWSEEDADE